MFLKWPFFSSRACALLILLAWMVMIFTFSSLSGKPMSGPTPLWYFIERKGAHVVEYAVLLVLFFRFLTLSFPRERFVPTLSLAAVCALAYGVTDELHQFFVPFRGARLTDVLIDGGGIVLAAGLILLWKQYKNRSKRSGSGR